MTHEGPVLEMLLHRLSECPSEFMEICKGKTGNHQLIAVIADHFRSFGEQNPARIRDPFFRDLQQVAEPSAKNFRYWSMLSIAIWLLHDAWFLERPQFATHAWKWLTSQGLEQLSEVIPPEQCLLDPDRREELVRLCLNALDLQPAGESIDQARDRLQTLDSIERKRILQDTVAAERRAREVREAMARARALESASRYGE